MRNEMINIIEKQQGESLMAYLNDILDIDYDKNIIHITNKEQHKEYCKINASHQYRGGDNAFQEWVSYCLFGGEDWFLYVEIGEFSKKCQYNSNGELEKSVSLSDNEWYVKEEDND